MHNLRAATAKYLMSVAVERSEDSRSDGQPLDKIQRPPPLEREQDGAAPIETVRLIRILDAAAQISQRW